LAIVIYPISESRLIALIKVIAILIAGISFALNLAKAFHQEDRTMNTQMSYCEGSAGQPLTASLLHHQNLAFQGTGGVSAGNRAQGFTPAFLDTDTGIIHLARYADGRPAPMHLLEGLPSELFLSCGAAGESTAVKPSLIAGFIRTGLFYTREQAARCV
jgi:hypothetical protein